eukprot:scaffold87848_cov26-Prasinocladus_malaysianus.AAC.1
MLLTLSERATFCRSMSAGSPGCRSLTPHWALRAARTSAWSCLTSSPQCAASSSSTKETSTVSRETLCLWSSQWIV